MSLDVLITLAIIVVNIVDTIKLILNPAIVILILKVDTINLNYHDIDNKIGILHITITDMMNYTYFQ